MKLASVSLLILAMAIFAGCSPKQKYRVYERLILHFDTPHGPTTASGVGVKTYRYYPDRLPLTNTRMTSSFEGEAIVIDFGSERIAFAVIARGIGQVVGYGAFDADYDKDPTALLEALAQTPDLFSIHSVPKRFWPQLVVFEDPLDPLSVRRAERHDIFPADGGAYALTGVEIEILDTTPTTKKIASILPWLSTVQSSSIDGVAGVISPDRPLSNELYRTQFIQLKPE
ncbi:MAG: hypothetical protein ACRBBV_14250 [Paracoccaceae bacterium]